MGAKITAAFLRELERDGLITGVKPMKRYPIISTEPLTDDERTSWQLTERREQERRTAHPDECRCPECDPDTHNDDAAIAAHEEDTDPSLHYWATYPVDWEYIAQGRVPDDEDPF